MFAMHLFLLGKNDIDDKALYRAAHVLPWPSQKNLVCAATLKCHRTNDFLILLEKGYSFCFLIQQAKQARKRICEPGMVPSEPPILVSCIVYLFPLPRKKGYISESLLWSFEPDMVSSESTINALLNFNDPSEAEIAMEVHNDWVQSPVISSPNMGDHHYTNEHKHKTKIKGPTGFKVCSANPYTMEPANVNFQCLMYLQVAHHSSSRIQ